jgi:hypothetical protein
MLLSTVVAVPVPESQGGPAGGPHLRPPSLLIQPEEEGKQGHSKIWSVVLQTGLLLLIGLSNHKQCWSNMLRAFSFLGREQKSQL